MCCGAERRSWRKSTHRCLLDENYFTNKFPVRSGIWFYAAACFSLFHFFFAHSPRRLCYVWCVLCLSQHIKGARNASRVYGAFNIGPKRFKVLCFWESFSDCVSSACAGVSVKFIKFFFVDGITTYNVRLCPETFLVFFFSRSYFSIPILSLVRIINKNFIRLEGMDRFFSGQ